MIQAIEKEWDTQEIPEAQREIFRFCVFCLPRHKSAPIIIKEIEDLRRRRSFVQLALRAVAAREESLKSIKEMNDYLERATDWQKMKDVKLEAAELLHAHRMLSLSATECVVKWRDQLMNAMLVNNPDNLRKVRILPFMWQGVSYIHKMKTDMDFLIFSDYAKIFKFSEKLDPMLISPSKPDKKKPAKIKENYFVEDGQVLIPIPDVLLKRVKWAESIILGEPYFEEDITSDPLKAFQNLDAFEDKNDLAQSLLITILEEALDFDLIETAKDARNLENSRFNDLSCKSICEEWAKVVAVQTAEEIGREIYREQSNDVLEKHFNAKFEKLMENEINKIVDAIAKEEIKSAKDDVKRIRNLNKAKNQEDIALSKLIYQELQDQAIRGMIEQEAQRVIDLRDKKAIKQQIAAEQKQLQLDNLEICKQLTFQYIDEILSGMDPEYERWIHEEIERREQIRESQIQTSLKALELSNMQISEALLRRLIETVISELKPDSFADSILNELIVDRKKNTKDAAALKRLETKELSLTNQKICEIIYEIILDESITQFNFEKLAENMIEAVSSERRRTTLTRTMTLAGASVVDEPEDYANENFTPGEHSPNEYSLAEHEMFEEEEEKEDSMSLGGIIGDLGLDFATIDMFKDLTGLVFRPISVAESQIIHVLNEYCRFIPSMNMSILPDINQLLQEVTSGIDPSWYWALKNDRILGMVVYSLDCIATTGRNLVIHHMSCLNELSFKDITDAAVDYMFKIDACDEIRINLWSPIGTDISAEYKRIFSELKFKWKTNTSKAEYQSAITVMGKSRSGNPNPDARKSQVMPFSLKAGCIIEVSSERVNPRDVTCEEMTQVGNRHCLLFGILNVFGKLNKNGIVLNQTPGTRLQGDVTDLLAIVNSTDSYNFPSIKGAVLANQEQSAKYLQSNGIDPRSAPQDKASIAILDISYK